MINLFPPALIRYTDDLPQEFGGQASGPFVRIRPKYEHDVGLHKHELFHVAQWWLTVFTHPLWYDNVRAYRQWSEVTAYRRQMRCPKSDGTPLSIDRAAELLAMPRYELGLSLERAKTLLS